MAANHLILQCGKLLKNVTEFIPLSSTIMPVDLDQAAERLQARIDINILLNPFKLRALGCNRCALLRNRTPEAFVTYPGAVRNKGVNVVLGLVVVKQTTPGQKGVNSLPGVQINNNQPLIKNQNRLTCRTVQVG